VQTESLVQQEPRRGFFNSPTSKAEFFIVLLGFIVWQVDFAFDFAFLLRHHLLFLEAGLYEIAIVVAMALFLSALWRNGWRKVEGEWKNLSIRFFSLAMFILLMSTMELRRIIEAIDHVRATLAH